MIILWIISGIVGLILLLLLLRLLLLLGIERWSSH